MSRLRLGARAGLLVLLLLLLLRTVVRRRSQSVQVIDGAAVGSPQGWCPRHGLGVK